MSQSMVTVPELIRAQAERTPDAVAVESAGDRLTYAELLAHAGGLADHLRRTGVRPGDLVAVAVPRGIDVAPTLIGVQLSGAGYVPLDPEHPPERLNNILRDAGARVLVTADAAGSPGLRPDIRVHLDDVAVRPDLDELPRLRPDATAYAIYTSGSTGRPKGVLVTHRALTNVIRSMRLRPGLPDDVVLPAVTTVSFDIAALELFLPLTTGGRVVVARQRDASDPHRLAALLAGAGARALQATPTTWLLLLEAGWSPPPGFTVLCGGERLPAELAERLLGDGVVLWDLYGPTETTIWSAVTRYERGAPAGFHPVCNTSLHLLDERLAPVPPGAEGELYIGGAGLAVGYLRRPALTASRFVADPYASGARLYRTGDVARRHPDGRIEILGRTDHQIKLRGFRIEPGEIENLLTRHPAVAEAVVRAVDDSGDGPRLVGYVRTADPAELPVAAELRRHLARLLPSYMVPAQFVVLDAFPRTPNGKLDRAALPTPPSQQRPDPRQHADPDAGTERRIAGVLADVLGRADVGPHDDFFALGGDSLGAIRAVNRLNAELDMRLPMNALFETRTVVGLALLLAGGVTPEPPIVAVASRTPRLSSAQWRLWLHQRQAPHSTAYNEPLAVPLADPLDLPALETALTGLLARHDVLRSRYVPGESGQPAPIVSPASAVRLAVEDGDPRSVLAAELARPFDLAVEPPIRVRLVRDAGGEHVLLLVLHHIATDDRSNELIASQLRAAYRGRAVATPTLRYADYAEWQRELAASPAAKRHLDFWRTALAGLAPAELVTDRPRPAIRDWRAGAVRFAVAPALAARLRDLAYAHDATAFMGLLAGFYGVLARHTTGTDLTVGVPVTARGRPELENVVGMFANTVVIRVDIGGRPSFAQLLARVREATLAAYGHAVTPFEDIVGAAVEPGTVGADPGRSPLFDVMFAVHGFLAESAGFPLPDPPGAKFDLCCHLTERPDGGLDGRIEYATQLFDAPTVTGLANGFVRLLEGVSEDPARPMEHSGRRFRRHDKPAPRP